jgi:hypothetical protein
MLLQRLSLFLLFTTVCLPVRAELQAGAASVSITPNPNEIPYFLGGYVGKPRQDQKATGIHDTCRARALVMQNGGPHIAVVSVELCFLPDGVVEEVAKRLKQKGMGEVRLFLSATHTHSAPDPLALHTRNTEFAGALPTYDPKLMEFVSAQIAAAVETARQRLTPVRLSVTQQNLPGFNRNRRGEKTTDEQLTLLKFSALNGQMVSALAVYAAHPVYYGAEMLQVSGDWCGAYMRQMEALHPGAVFLYLNGAEGDASPSGADEGTSTDKIQTYSARITRRTTDMLAAMPVGEDAPIKWWEQTVELGKPEPNPLFLLAGAALKATPQQSRALINRTMPETTRLTMVQVGECLLLGMPGEPTTPIGLAAKQLCRDAGIKFPAVVALTNGWLGYLVTAEQYRAGKYEPSMSFYGPGIGEKILGGVSAALRARK